MDTAVSSAASTAAMASAVTASPTTVTSGDKGTTPTGSIVTLTKPTTLLTTSTPIMHTVGRDVGSSAGILAKSSIFTLPFDSAPPHPGLKLPPMSSYSGITTGLPPGMSYRYPSMPYHAPGMSGIGDHPIMLYPSGLGGYSSTAGHPSAMMSVRSGAESPTPTETGSLSGAESPTGTDSLSRDEKFARFAQNSLLGLKEDIFNKSSSFISKMETKATAHSDATSSTLDLDYSSLETSESLAAEEAPAQSLHDVRLPPQMEAGFKSHRKEVTVNHENRSKELKTHYDKAMTENEANTKAANLKVNQDTAALQEKVNTLTKKVETLEQQLNPDLAPKGSQDADYEAPPLSDTQLEDLNAKLRDARLELYNAKLEVQFEIFKKDQISLESELHRSLLSDDHTLAAKTFEFDKQRGLNNIENERALAQRAILDEQTAERSPEPSVREKTSTETPTPTKASLEESVEPTPITEELVSEVAESDVKTHTSATKSRWGFGSLLSSLLNPFAGVPDADYTKLETPLSEEVIKSEDVRPAGDEATASEKSLHSAQLEEVRAELAQLKAKQQAIRDSEKVRDSTKALTAKIESEFPLKDDTSQDGKDESTKF